MRTTRSTRPAPSSWVRIDSCVASPAGVKSHYGETLDTARHQVFSNTGDNRVVDYSASKTIVVIVSS